MSTIVLRSVKGTPLTNAEVDANFSNLNTDKTELGGTYSSGTANGVLFLSSSKVLTSGSALTFDGTNFQVANGDITLGVGNYKLTANDAYLGFASNKIALNNSLDQIKFTVAASEQMRLTSTGLGIGTSSPAAKLHANSGSAARSGLFQSTTTGAGIEFLDSTTTINPGIYGIGNSTTFWNGSAEQMRLTSTGLGIGTSSPAYKLDIANATYARLTTTTYSNGGLINARTALSGGTYNTFDFVEGSTTTGYLRNYGSVFGGGVDNHLRLWNTQAAPITFGTSDTERMRLDSSGNLGLGVTPSAWSGLKALEIAGVGSSLASASNNNLFLSSNAWYNGSGWRYGTTAAASQYQSFSGQHAWYTAPSGTAGDAISFTQAMTLDASGNLGIGATSPAAKLHVLPASYPFGTTFVETIRIQNNATGGTPANQTSLGALTWASGTTTFASINGIIQNASASLASALAFYTHDGTNQLERARIDSSGNLGLGVTPSGSWGSPALMLGKPGAGNPTYPFLTSTDTQQLVIGSNSYWDGTNWKAAFAGAGIAAMQQRISYNQIAWFTAPNVAQGVTQSFTQAMTLDASGNLLVGTTSALAKLTVEHAMAFSGPGVAKPSGLGYGMYLLNGIGTVVHSAATLAFAAGDTERARIDSSGNLMVGTTSNLGGVTARQAIQQGSNTYVQALQVNGSSGTAVIFLTAGTGGVGSISLTGTTTSYNTTSDQRLKENIADAESASALIDSLQVRQYDWKADGSHQRYGFVAQELVTVAPEAVHQHEDPEAMMAVDYSKLVPMLVKEIQSLRARVAQLEVA